MHPVGLLVGVVVVVGVILRVLEARIHAGEFTTRDKPL